MIQNCGLVEFPSLGNYLSWGDFVEYLAMIGSDHMPILATIEDKIMRGRKQFRFNKCWIGRDDLMDSIANGWDTMPDENGSNFVDIPTRKFQDGRKIFFHTVRKKFQT